MRRHVRELALAFLWLPLAIQLSMGQEGDARRTYDEDQPLLGEGLSDTDVARQHQMLQQQLRDARRTIEENSRKLHKEKALARAQLHQNQHAKMVLQKLVKRVSGRGEQQGEDLGESGPGLEPGIQLIMGYRGPSAPEPKENSAGPQAGANQDGTVTKVVGNTAVTAPSKDESFDGMVQQFTKELRAKKPELGIWPGHRTPDLKVEAMTAEGVAEEERRARLTPEERAEEDTSRFVAKPIQEVEDAMKMPGPLVYTPPLDTEEVIEERAREAKVKSKEKTVRDQAIAQEKSQKLVDAAERGLAPVKSKKTRKINENGIFCTPSKQDGCVKVVPLMDKIQCNADVQLCQFESPTTPGKMEITEPQIPCPFGREDCVIGAANVEAEYWLKAHKQNMTRLWIQASKDAKAQDKDRDTGSLINQENAERQQKVQNEEMGAEMVSFQLTDNRPDPEGKKEPLPQIDPANDYAGFEARELRMRAQLGKVDTTLKKLGILTMGCEEDHGRCLKDCVANPWSLRKDPDGTVCRTSCADTRKTCMISKIKKAQFAAGVAAAARAQPLEANVELGEGIDSSKEGLPDLPKEKLKELAKNPKLSGMATACQDGMPGSCDQLKNELAKEKVAHAAVMKKKQEEAELLAAKNKNAEPAASPMASNSTAAAKVAAKSAAETPAKAAAAKAAAAAAKPAAIPASKPTAAAKPAVPGGPPALNISEIKLIAKFKAKTEAKEEAEVIASQMKKQLKSEHKEMRTKKEGLQKNLTAWVGDCAKDAEKDCSQEAVDYKNRLVSEIDDNDQDEKQDLEDKTRTVHEKCMRKAKWDCKKKGLEHMTEKYDTATTQMLKVKKDLGPWFAEQAKEKKKKDHAKAGAMEIKAKAEIEAKKLVSNKATFTKTMDGLTKMQAACRNEWPTDHCSAIYDHCASHVALRYKCKQTCAACDEKFDFVTPKDGREIAYAKDADAVKKATSAVQAISDDDDEEEGKEDTIPDQR